MTANRFRILEINYKSGNCQVYVMIKQILKLFPSNKNPRIQYKLERVYSNLCYISSEFFDYD